MSLIEKSSRQAYREMMLNGTPVDVASQEGPASLVGGLAKISEWKLDRYLRSVESDGFASCGGGGGGCNCG